MKNNRSFGKLLTLLLRYRNRSNSHLDEMPFFRGKKEEIAPITPGFRILYKTRWIVTGDSLETVHKIYCCLQGCVRGR